MGKDSTLRHGLSEMTHASFGIIVAETHKEIAGLLLEGAERTLKEAGCREHKIQLHYVPRLDNLAMATQFLAEYTDVDGVILLGALLGDEREEETEQIIRKQVMTIQLHWNMPCIWGVIKGKSVEELMSKCYRGSEAAIEAMRMVQMQIEMEAQAPNTPPDRQNLN